MKRFVIALLSPIMWVISQVYSYNLSRFLRKCLNSVYTLWIRNFMGEMPLDSKIAFPCGLSNSGTKQISIGHNTYIDRHCILGCWESTKDYEGKPSIRIGNNCTIGEYTQISACSSIVISDGLLTGRFVYIGDNSHGGLSYEEASISPNQRDLLSRGPVMIGKNVWIGDKVTILGGITIGDNVIIGANSVVTHDIPSNCVAVGSPAKVIKQLKNKDE